MTYRIDFVNNDYPPKRDGITVYKINQKTHNRIEVGTIIGGKIVFNKPKKLLVEVKEVKTYYHDFKVYTNEKQYDGSVRGYSSTYKDNRELFVRENLHTWSIGWWEDDKLVLWSQYE